MWFSWFITTAGKMGSLTQVITSFLPLTELASASASSFEVSFLRESYPLTVQCHDVANKQGRFCQLFFYWFKTFMELDNTICVHINKTNLRFIYQRLLNHFFNSVPEMCNFPSSDLFLSPLWIILLKWSHKISQLNTLYDKLLLVVFLFKLTPESL